MSKQQRKVLNTIKRRKLKYFVRIMRNPKLLHIQEKIEGKRGPGR